MKTKSIGQHYKDAKKASAKAAKPPKLAKPPKPPSKRESLQAEVDRLRREIKAYKAHESRAKLLANEVEACQAEVEAAKAETAARKTNLASANEALARFIRGGAPKDAETGKQQTFVPDKPKGTVPPLIDPKGDGASAFVQGKELGADPHPKESTESGLWVVGYCQAKWAGLEDRKAITYAVTTSSLMDAIAPDALPPLESQPEVKAVRFMDYPWLVVDGWKAEEKGNLRFVCLQLFKKDEWKALWQPTYGKPCAGEDANAEAKTRRQAGGVDCGRVVKVGKELFVVGPRSAGCILVAPAVELGPKEDAGTEPEQLTAPFDAKAAAANDTTNDDSDEGDA